MRDQEKRNLIKTGIFMSSLLAVLMIFATLIGKENKWLSPKLTIKASVPSANNLKEGGIVQLQGINIGRVEKIQIAGPNEVSLTLEITQEHLKWIKKDSKVDISSQGLVGDKLLKISAGSKDSSPFDPDVDVLKSDDSLNIPDLARAGGEIAQQADKVLLKLEQFLDQLNKDQMVSKTLSNLSQAATKLNSILDDMQRRGFTQKLTSSMGQLDQAMARLNNGPGTLHSLIYEDELYNRLNQIVGGAGRSDVLKYFIRKSLDEEQSP